MASVFTEPDQRPASQSLRSLHQLRSLSRPLQLHARRDVCTSLAGKIQYPPPPLYTTAKLSWKVTHLAQTGRIMPLKFMIPDINSDPRRSYQLGCRTIRCRLRPHPPCCPNEDSALKSLHLEFHRASQNRNSPHVLKPSLRRFQIIFGKVHFSPAALRETKSHNTVDRSRGGSQG